MTLKSETADTTVRRAAYVLVRSDDLRPGPDLARYVSEVDATLESHGAQILVQGFPARVVEGEWGGFVTLLRFPSRAAAEQWYDSDAYAAIRGLRQASSRPTGIVVEEVAPGHRSRDLLTMLTG